MSPSHLISALEELARKRGELTAAIVTLATVAGIDPAAYLADSLARDAVSGVPPKAEAPPRPQRPASQTTNGTGRAHKVEGGTPARILDVLKAHGEPMQPKALSKALRMEWSAASYHVKKLAKAKQLVLSGTTSTRRIALP